MVAGSSAGLGNGAELCRGHGVHDDDDEDAAGAGRESGGARQSSSFCGKMKRTATPAITPRQAARARWEAVCMAHHPTPGNVSDCTHS